MIRIALIGCNHATAGYRQFASRLQGARFAAVVDSGDNLARRTAKALEVPLWATSLEDLLRDNADAFDAVVIRRTDGSPKPVVAQAAAAGKHVLLDMPLMLRVPQDDTTIEACQSAGVTFMLGQVTRFLPSVAEVKSCLKSGVLGSPGLLRIHDWRPPDKLLFNRHIEIASDPRESILETINRYYGQTIGESADSMLQEFTDMAIEFTETDEDLEADTAIFKAVLPDLDLANWIFDALPTEVFAAGHVGYVQVHLGYPDGGMALVDHSMMLAPGSDYFSLSVFGSDGAAYADDHHNMHLLYRGGRPTALPAGQGMLHHLAELQEFVGAIRASRPPAITADDAFKATEVVRAAAQSLKSGRAMRLNGGCYEPV